MQKKHNKEQQNSYSKSQVTLVGSQRYVKTWGVPFQNTSLLYGVDQIYMHSRPSPCLTDAELFVQHLTQQDVGM